MHEMEPRDYERLEFLGDSVLEFLSATRIYLLHPTVRPSLQLGKQETVCRLTSVTIQLLEGELTTKKKDYICNAILGQAANRMHLSHYVLTEGSPSLGMASLPADAFEALIGNWLTEPQYVTGCYHSLKCSVANASGVIFLVRGIDETNHFCERWLFQMIEEVSFTRSPLFTKPVNDLGSDIRTCRLSPRTQ